jgi:hypothetical protein
MFPGYYILVLQLFDAIRSEYQRHFKTNYEPDSFQILDFKDLFFYRSEFKMQLLNHMTDVWNFLTRLNDKIKK